MDETIYHCLDEYMSLQVFCTQIENNFSQAFTFNFF